jgi:transcriptional regulator with GAF, ATPase, and Fis domain
MQSGFAGSDRGGSVSGVLSAGYPVPQSASLRDDAAQRLHTLRQTSFAGMISECREMQKVFTVVEKVAATNSTVLILGESGTGKELIARALHRLSGRSGKLVPVNCGAIPEEILESELFGHERGAFTGAIANKIGRFQLADGGTIFLDEIGEMSPKLQVKLLRVLQERKIEPVGSTRTIDVNVRVVAATNKDLREEVKAGRFREDLYYRLQVVPITLPALRERGADVVVLARYFLERSALEVGRTGLTLTPEVEQKLRDYQWPGNVRELENLIERLAVLSDRDLISVHELPEYIHETSARPIDASATTELPPDGIDFNALVDQYETQLINLALERTSGNKKAAAKLLRLNRTTLVEKIKKKGLAAQIETVIESDTDAAY